MTGNIIASPFSIKNGRLYIGGDEHSRREVTHVRVQNADGVKYLKLSVSAKESPPDGLLETETRSSP